MASEGAMVEAAKAKRQHVFHGERVQAFSDAVFAIVATFAVGHHSDKENRVLIMVKWNNLLLSL